jgi:glycosyltransferase involved in cell wall biosynthesis
MLRPSEHPIPDVSVVVPVWNEEQNIDALFDRLTPVLDGTGLSWEIVCINDGSTDGTLARLTVAHGCNPRIKVVDLSRNFGKDAALSAGLDHAAGRVVIPMDGDLQHPPEVIPELIAKWREGFEMVYAVRRSRQDQGFIGRMTARLFYWTFDKFAEVKLPHGAGDFRLLDRKVVEALKVMRERNRFMKGIFTWVGFRQTGVYYDVADRNQGTSKWHFRSLLKFGLSGIAAFSNMPLRMCGMLGAAISLFAFAYIVVRLIHTAIYGIDVPGYESILVTILFLGGIQLISLGVLGDYLGRVFDEVRGRPLYLARDRIGFAQPADVRRSEREPVNSL